MVTNTATIDTSNVTNPIGSRVQRSLFWMANRWWAFYLKTTNKLYYTTSVDGATWTTPVQLDTIDPTNDPFCGYFDGSYFHYAAALSTNVVVYRRGNPNSDGTFTWSAAEQTVANTTTFGSVSVQFGELAVAVDSAGYPFVGFLLNTVALVVSKSSTNDGTWTTAGGFPYSYMGAQAWLQLIPLTNQKMAACGWSGTSTGTQNVSQFRIWDGTQWGNVIPFKAGPASSVAGEPVLTAIGDTIHAVYADTTGPPYNVKYRNFTVGTSTGWSTEQTIYTAPSGGSSPPCISAHTIDSTLYAFWIDFAAGNSLTFQSLQYKNGAWQTTPTAIDTETSAIVGSYGETIISALGLSYDGSGIIFYLGHNSPFTIKTVVSYNTYEPAVAVGQLLYSNWSITSPARDSLGIYNVDQTGKLATQDPSKVHFTNRHYAFSPTRLHQHQISVKPLTKPYRPIQLGTPTKYWNPENLSIHIWVLPGNNLTIEDAYTDLYNMMVEVRRIIRIMGEGADSNIQHILLGPWQDRNELDKDPPRLHVEARVVCHIFEMSTS